ncbi:MAG TPA: DoxX family protein [Mucilaginibacter sp.]
MKKGKLIVYWIATALLSAGMLGSGISQLMRAKQMVDIITHLGYPLYIMTILGVWKILGVIVILVPGFKLIKEWAYAGLFFAMSGALISHLIMGDSGKAVIGPLAQSIFVILSWYCRPANRKINPANQ